VTDTAKQKYAAFCTTHDDKFDIFQLCTYCNIIKAGKAHDYKNFEKTVRWKFKKSRTEENNVGTNLK